MPFSILGAFSSVEGPEWKWLKSLQGDSPLLKSSEFEFISQVVQSIIKEAGSGTNIHHNQHMEKKIPVINDNFEEVVKYLKKHSKDKDYFLKNYESWRSCRDRSISKLIDISTIVNNNSKESASTRYVGGTVSLVGGLMCFIPGLGALRLAGGAMMALGSLAAFGASIIEFDKLQERVKEAEKILLVDRTYSEELWNWMSDMSHIQEAYNTITSIDTNLEEITKELYACYKEKSSPPEMLIAIEKAVKELNISPKMANKISEVIGKCIAFFMLHERYRTLFNIAFKIWKIKRMLISCNGVATAANVTTVFLSGKNAKLSPFQKWRLGIGIALDVISIIQAAKDLEETCKEAIAITNAAKKLQEEADIFDKLYDELKRV